MSQDFKYLNIVFIISGGVLTCLILFIFAKRQITRFALRSRRGPHIPIGTDAKKVSTVNVSDYLLKFTFLTCNAVENHRK